MKTVFRLYAKTTKGNDQYLYNELINSGLKPKHEEIMHSFYFNATFKDLFNLSFHSLTLENMYIQLGHKFPLNSDYMSSGKTYEELASQFFTKINFRNYIPIERNIIENISLNILVRESSRNMPSDNVLLSLLRNHLDKEVITKQYKKMGIEKEGFINYYDIKQIVHKKWEHEDRLREQQKIEALPANSVAKLQIQGDQSILKSATDIQGIPDQHNNGLEIRIPYQPHFVLYIRRNHARLLLKLNKDVLYKHGWKKNIGWGPVRESLVASVLYRTGLFHQKEKAVTLWDPFCGSGTIPLVACSMLGSLRVRQNCLNNFVWQHFPIYKPEYLQEYLKEKKEQTAQSLKSIKILGSDIDIKSINNSMANFNNFLKDNELECKRENRNEKFLGFTYADQLFELLPNRIHLALGDFDKIASKIFSNNSGQLDKEKQKISIVTNLPYLGERSKEHIPLNQLKSVYKRFNSMINENKDKIDNVFVLINADEKQNRNHFLMISSEEWRILGNFDNGGIEVHLLAWGKNKDGWKEILMKKQANSVVAKLAEQKGQFLEEYREEVKEIDQKRYEVPKYLVKHKSMHGWKRILEKRKARHLRAAYMIFAKRKDKNMAYDKYARKELALKLTQRGKSWKRKNMSLIGNNLLENEQLIKNEFERKIEQALARQEEKKNRKTPQIARKW